MSKWVVAFRYEEPHELVSRFPADALGVTVNGERVEFGPPACFVVANAQNLSEERGRFDDPGKASNAAEELNRLEAQGPLAVSLIRPRPPRPLSFSRRGDRLAQDGRRAGFLGPRRLRPGR